MSKSEAVLEAAERWWAEMRPVGWSQERHLNSPISCRDATFLEDHVPGDPSTHIIHPEQAALMRAIADMVKERAEDTRR